MNAKRMYGLLAAMALCLPVAAMAQQMGTGVVALTGPGAGASEDFNSLANAHNSTSAALPAGWYFLEAGGNANGTYLVDDGTNASGNTFSYGTQGSSDRAFGALASGSLQTTIGAQLQNNSGAALVDLDISFFVEQWRLGSLNGADTLTFAYSTNATSLSSGSWTAFAGLDAVSPVTSGTAESKLDGNAAANRAQVSATLTGLNLAPGASLWIRWSDVNDAGVDDALAIDDIVFGTPVDIPPYLHSSFPEDGGEFPTNASLILTFSEPVDVEGVWFEIQCAASGYYTPSNTTVSGGATVYTLTPNTPLLADDACELTLETQLIVDQGSEGYELDDPGVIAFTTIAPPPNQAPELLSTVPTQGASNFPSAGDLHAVFNEPVTALAGAFSLTCDESTGIAPSASSSDGGITWTIGTGTALVAGDACTFTIDAAFIHDLDLDDPLPLVAGATIAFTVADFGNVGAYYQNINLATPATLRCSIYDTIKGHTKLSYGYTVPNLADEDPYNSNLILDLFKNERYPKQTSGDANYNREHAWPRSYGLGNTGTPGPATDYHMLHLTDTTYNNHRGNKPFANCNSGCIKYATTPNHGIGGNSDADSNWTTSEDGTGGSFEPWDHIKGNMARAVMYMAVRYQGESGEPLLELTDNRSLYRTRPNSAAPPSGTYYMGDLTALLEWNSFDAPTARELDRNQIVQSYQNNRNPFVDHPEWARRELFETPRPASCTLNLNAPVASNDSYVVAQDGTLPINAAAGVLHNDTDVEFDTAGSAPAGWFTLTAARLSEPTNGAVSLAANGSFTYTPEAGFCGTDSFTYRTSDGVRWSAPATVTITVGSDCETGVSDIFADGFEQD